MKKTGLALVAGLVVVAAAGGAYFFKGRQPAQMASSEPTVLAWAPEVSTPVGITLQYIAPIKTKAGFFVQGINARGDTVVYADGLGKALYTYAKDQPGQSTCTAECATAWPPMPVLSPSAKAFGAWSIITRQDGAKQWAFNGKPLYTCAKDDEVGLNKCKGADSGAWSAAEYDPKATMQLPQDFGVEDLAAAPGEGLVNSEGRTVYAFNGNAKKDQPVCAAGTTCISPWTPIPAAALANPIGNFSVVVRADGTRQWAYKGLALYTYKGDLETGDVLGLKVDPRFAVAVVEKHFMPEGAGITRVVGQADLLIDPKGMTLYKRDESFQLVTGHGLPHSIPGIPAMGRAIGTNGCDAECLKSFRPYAAPANAEPSGFWKVAVRQDGTKQWVYKDYALYTYVNDKQPGDIAGDQIYDVSVDDGTKPNVVDLVPTTNGAALYWAFVEP